MTNYELRWTLVIAAILVVLVTLRANANDLQLMIQHEATHQGLDPKLALAVATVESGLDQGARGSHGEVGVFQLMPAYAKGNVYDAHANVREGVRQLIYWKNNCPVRDGINWVLCYNEGSRRPKFPHLFPYVKKVRAVYNVR